MAHVESDTLWHPVCTTPEKKTVRTTKTHYGTLCAVVMEDNNLLALNIQQNITVICKHRILLQHVSVTTLRETLLGPQSTSLIRVLMQEAALQHKVNSHLIDNTRRLVGTFLGNTRSNGVRNSKQRSLLVLFDCGERIKCGTLFGNSLLSSFKCE